MRTASLASAPSTRGLCPAIFLWIVFFAFASSAHAQEKNISGCNVSKPLKVVESKDFDLIYLDGCWLEAVWNDKGSGKDQSISIWQPRIAALARGGDGAANDSIAVKFLSGGWYYPGEMITAELDLTGESTTYATFLFKPKEGRDDVKAPTGFKKVWDDADSGADHDVSVWELQCPSGYVALGLHAKAGHGEPGGTRMGCVRKSLTHPVAVDKSGKDENGSVWSTRHNDADNFAFYRPKNEKIAGSLPKNTLLIPPPTFWGKKDSYDPPASDKFRGLRLKVEVPSGLLPGKISGAPVLTEPTVENWEAVPIPKEYEISALMVHDPDYSSDLARLMDSPKYHVYRETKWMPIGQGVTCGWDEASPCTWTITETKGESETTTWNNTIGAELSVMADASFKPLGIGAGLEITASVNYSHEFGGDEGTSEQEAIAEGHSLKPGTFMAAFREETTVELYRHNDDTRSEHNLVRRYQVKGDDARIVTRIVALPNENRPAGCGDVRNRDLVECGLPAYSIHHLPQNERIMSESGNHYLIFTKYHTLEVRKAGVGRAQHAHVWSIDQKHDPGRHGAPIDWVDFEDGQLCAEGTGKDHTHFAWCNIEKEDAVEDSYLDIDEEGNLLVKAADGEIIWNSEYDEEEES